MLLKGFLKVANFWVKNNLAFQTCPLSLDTFLPLHFECQELSKCNAKLVNVGNSNRNVTNGHNSSLSQIVDCCSQKSRQNI